MRGGEMQKIAIARGLYKDSLCFIADEPTAALDPLSEAEIYKRILGETKNNAVIFISHRMSSCKDCDDIIVMDNGSLVERGTHEELIAQEGIYNLLWSTQAKYYATVSYPHRHMSH